MKWSVHALVVLAAALTIGVVSHYGSEIKRDLAWEADDRQLAAQLLDMNDKIAALEKSNARLQKSLDSISAYQNAQATQDWISGRDRR